MSETVREPYIDEVTRLLQDAKAFGTAQSTNGAALYGHVPHVAPEAWFHTLYPPLSDEGISALESSLGRPIPSPYAEWLRHSNGLRMFSGALSLDGFRRGYSRRSSDIREPFDLTTPNIEERPADATDCHFFFGGYECDGSLLAMDDRDLRIFRCARHSVDPMNHWADFATMLIAEARRLSSLFDERGRQRDPDRQTTPE